jgi:hypothetical protein
MSSIEIRPRFPEPWGDVDVVGVLGRDSEQAVAAASNQDRRLWLLNGLGPHDCIVEPVVSTFKGRALITPEREVAPGR